MRQAPPDFPKQRQKDSDIQISSRSSTPAPTSRGLWKESFWSPSSLPIQKTGRVLGAQCIGPGNVSKQIAQWAMAIQGKLTVEDIINADLPYAPPFSLAIDHFIATAHIMQNKMKGRLKGISCKEVQRESAKQ